MGRDGQTLVLATAVLSAVAAFALALGVVAVFGDLTKQLDKAFWFACIPSVGVGLRVLVRGRS